MFSHYINHLENTRVLEGHQTLMVHECLTVASALGHFHRWQRRVEPGDRDKQEWAKVPVVNRRFLLQIQYGINLDGQCAAPCLQPPQDAGTLF